MRSFVMFKKSQCEERENPTQFRKNENNLINNKKVLNSKPI